MTTARHLVVVAGAEPPATDELAEGLRDEFAVRTAYSDDGLAASLDDEVDVVLVDPAVPGFSFAALRNRIRERALDCQVGVLVDEPIRRDPASSGSSPPSSPSASDARPPTDPGRRDSPDRPAAERAVVDAYVSTTGASLRDSVEWLARRAYYRKRLEEFYSLTEERASLLTARGGDDADDGGGGADSNVADDANGSGDPNGSGDAAAERERLERHLARVRRDLADTYRNLDTKSAFEAVLDRPVDDE